MPILLLLCIHLYTDWSNIGANYCPFEAPLSYACINKQACLTLCLVQDTSIKEIYIVANIFKEHMKGNDKEKEKEKDKEFEIDTKI